MEKNLKKRLLKLDKHITNCNFNELFKEEDKHWSDFLEKYNPHLEKESQKKYYYSLKKLI